MRLQRQAEGQLGPRILLIEDSPADALLVSVCLREGDLDRCDLMTVSSLEAGIEELREGADAVLLDLILPDSAGLETLLRVRIAAPDVPVIVLSSTRDDALAKQCIGRGAVAFLRKESLSAPGLGAALRGAIERRGPRVGRVRRASEIA